MTRTMYDSTSAVDIPTSAHMVAGYVDGIYAWSPADWARFPDAVHVPIAVRASTLDGVVLDVENGDATPDEAPLWVERRRVAGVDPTVYCSLSAWVSVRAAFTAAGVVEPHWWIASYDNRPTIPDGAVAKQYADPPESGGHYDLSIVADYWPGVDPHPEVDVMQFLQKQGDPAQYVVLGGALAHVTKAEWEAYGSPPPRVLPPTHPVWQLPIVKL